jgi:transcriptional regulator with XRE-family HTH domain
MKLAERIRMARRKRGVTQQALASKMKVNRSAVANWESGGAAPSTGNFQRLAEVCEVAYEWLSTGRGEMLLPAHVHDVPAAHALLVEDPAEMRLLRAYRRAPPRVKLVLLDMSELQVVNRSPRRDDPE